MVRVISAAKHFQDVGNACLAGRGQSVEVRPADGAGVGAQRERLDDVRAAADAAVDDDLDPTGRPLDDLREDVEG